MSDTYNPNEILKLKHLNEFAAQFTAKLTGNSQQRTPNFRYQHGVSGSHYSYDGTLARIPKSALVLRENPDAYQFALLMRLQSVGYPSVFPQLSSINENGCHFLGTMTTSMKCILGSATGDLKLTILIETNDPGTFTIKIKIPAGDGFAYYEDSINVEIYDDTN